MSANALTKVEDVYRNLLTVVKAIEVRVPI